MSVDRTVSLTLRQRVHSAAAKTLVEAVGGVEHAAEICRAGKSQLSDYGHRNVASFIPSDVIEALEAVADEPHVTRVLARAAGFALVRLPAAPDGDGDWHQAIAAVSKETSEIIERICIALADGKVTAGEVSTLKIREEIAEAIEKLTALDALAARAPEGE